MAQTSSPPTETGSVSTGNGSWDGPRPPVDPRQEQLAQTTRILDLQIEGSRAIYRDALGIFLVNVLTLTGLLAAGFVLTSTGGLAVEQAAGVSVALLGFGTLALFVSMAYATKAYLGDIADYARPVSNVDGEGFVEQTISRNIKTIKRNAGIMESKVEDIRTSLLSLVGGLGGLFLALGFQLVPLDSWVQVVVSLNALVVVGYVLVHVMGFEYFEAGKDRLLR